MTLHRKRTLEERRKIGFSRLKREIVKLEEDQEQEDLMRNLPLRTQAALKRQNHQE